VHGVLEAVEAAIAMPVVSTMKNHWPVARKITGLRQRQQCG